MTTIHLGHEVGNGDAVEIPLLNLAVTGQTQQSGKTTTLEALVRRSGVRALTFVTKRGESAFAEARRIQPYFRDRADWQFVTSIIDATLQEKNKFLRPWIMKICRSTETLADVQTEVRAALKKATGLNEGVYTQLDAYLDLIVPEIKRAQLSDSLHLTKGVNVIDVSSYATPMQMLFIQSAIDWVNERESNTVVVIPEAWEFVPEGKSSPVKASATTLVRKGSGIGNHVWLDSQDMAGVDKVLLRGCPVWLIGVQREANEIKRNLSNIPASIKKPSPAAVATLERGQFYACWGNHAIKTYVQPVWMSGDDAQYVARGFAVDPSRLKPPAMASVADAWNRGDDKYRVEVLGQKPLLPTRTEEPTVTEQEAQRLRDENATLMRRVAELERFINEPNVGDSVEITRRGPQAAAPTPATRVSAGPHLSASNGHETPVGSALDLDANAIYAMVKERLTKEAPGILRVLTIKPELEVRIERKTLEVDGSTPKGRIARLFAKGWFDEGRTQGGTRAELRRTGTDVNSGTISTTFAGLVKDGFLTSESGDTYVAVADMKVRVVEA